MNEVANHFENNGLDLLNQPIFQDSNFNDENVKENIEAIMESIKSNLKSRIDEKSDIEIKIEKYYQVYDHTYEVIFSHKTPGIIGKTSLSKNKFVELKNIQTSPEKDLANFMEEDTVKNSIEEEIKIDENYFNDLNACNRYDFWNLKNDNPHLSSCLETHIWETGLSFSKLSPDKKINVRFTPKEIVSKELNSIKVKYEFESKKSGVTAKLEKEITFTK